MKTVNLQEKPPLSETSTPHGSCISKSKRQSKQLVHAVMVSRLGDSVSVPKGLLRDLHEKTIMVEEVLATLEELMDKQGLKRIRKAEAEYKSGEYTIVGDSHEIEKLIK